MQDQAPLAARTAAWVAVLIGAFAVATNLRGYLCEQRSLKALLRRLLPHGRVETREDLITLKRFLSASISYDLSKRHDRRPLLRQSAATTLARGEGFCGENARVAIRLLNLGGVRAHRLYLQGKRWSHVLVEHDWENGPRLFDSHPDPGTLLRDEDVGRIGPSEFDRLPNAYHELNPWLASFRIKLPQRPTLWRPLSQCRPPRLLVAVAESPDLLRALAGLALLCAGLLAASAL